jgi:uncharacterized protein YjbJ (UPF0337 family)
MNWDRVEGNWGQFQSQVKQTWSKLTAADLERIAGRREALVGRLQDSYGFTEEEAERQVLDWETRMRA